MQVGVVRIQRGQRVLEILSIGIECPAARRMRFDMGDGGLTEGVVAEPAGDGRIAHAEAADELRAVVVLVDVQAEGCALTEDACVVRVAAHQPLTEIVLPCGEVHAASRLRWPMPRAMASSSSRSARVGMSSSRSIMVATGPSRSTAVA